VFGGDFKSFYFSELHQKNLLSCCRLQQFCDANAFAFSEK
jgi:hypothetical protein